LPDGSGAARRIGGGICRHDDLRMSQVEPPLTFIRGTYVGFASHPAEREGSSVKLKFC
jgi:hypothetical protein